MRLVRLLLVVLVTLSASLSGAMAAVHGDIPANDHAVMAVDADTQSACCDDGAERSQTCHAQPALVPATMSSDPATGSDVAVFACVGPVLTGIVPSGPLDPPRVV